MSSTQPTERERVDTAWLVTRLDGTSAADIARKLTAMIGEGSLATGTQLPTIRDIAGAIGVSASTVAEAWAQLRDAGLVETNRRGGTTVLPTAEAQPGDDTRFLGWQQVDLVQCSPDVTLQPPLRDALLNSLTAEGLNAWGREYMTARLRTAVEPSWPFPAEAWMTAGGGTEALLLATAAAAPPGSLVAIDEPVVPGFLDTLRGLELTPIGVRNDEFGPTPASLAAALTQNPAAFIYQPGSPFAREHSVSAQRITELAEVILAHDAPLAVIEDDSLGPLATRPVPSLGAFLPHQVLRIRSYCKAYGTDLRTSVLGGSRELIERAALQRSHGVGSNSRILQNALAHLITDRTAAATVERAAARYAARKNTMLEMLAEAGVPATSGPESLVIWIEVPDETSALLELAQHGIAVGSGRKSFVDDVPQGLLRVSVMQLPDDAAEAREFARLVARASTGTLRGFFD